MPEPSQIEPRGRQEAARTPQKPKKKTDPAKKWIPSNNAAPFFAKKSPTWLQVGLPNQRKIEEKSVQKSIEKTMHLGIDFWTDFGGFLDAKWRHVGTNIDQKSMPTSKTYFLKKTLFFLRKNNDFEGSGGRSWR